MKRLCPYSNAVNHEINSFNAVNPETRENPHAFYKWLQEKEERRVYKLPDEQNFYLLHHYEDVKQALQNKITFTNAILPTKRNFFFPLSEEKNHQLIRSILSDVLLDKKKLPLDKIQCILEEETNRLIGTEKSKLYEEWAERIPLLVLLSILDIKATDEIISEIKKATLKINKGFFVIGGTGEPGQSVPSFRQKLFIAIHLIRSFPILLKISRKAGIKSVLDCFRMLIPKPQKKRLEMPRPNFMYLAQAIEPLLYLNALFIEQLNKPSDSIFISTLQREIKQKSITAIEAASACSFVLFAGQETTASALANMIIHLTYNPNDFNELKQQDELHKKQFINETLRYYTPIGRFLRRTLQPIKINGSVIPKDALVLLLYGAANTDDNQFPCPYEFDPKRTNANTHISFGKGSHFCLGSILAEEILFRSLNIILKNCSALEYNNNQPLKIVSDRDNGILRFEEFHITFVA